MLRLFGTKTRLLVAAATLVGVGAGCGSSSKPSTPSGASGSAGHKPITVGILTELTGPGASSNETSVQGVHAAEALAARDGYTLKYTVADTATSPAQVLSAAQQLVDVDHVDAIVSVSSLMFAASSWLTAHGIPVVGIAEDGPEWLTAPNMFSSFGPQDTTKVMTNFGQFMKMKGATNIGSVGYSISPSSAEAAKGAAVSAQQAGLKVGYLNSSFPFGSTNVQPVALGMKSDHVDGFTASVEQNTSFALLTALRQVGDAPKVALLATGYGGDLLDAGAGAMQAAQGVYFFTSWEPMEMNTAATRQFAADLKTIGITNDPTYAEYSGYTSIALLLQGLEGAGPNPGHAALITSLSHITNFDAAGLLGAHPLNMSARQPVTCEYFAQFSGSMFHVVPNAAPLCGSYIPGKTVSSSS